MMIHFKVGYWPSPQTLERLARYKQCSLFQTFVNYGHKSFKTLAPGQQGYNITFLPLCCFLHILILLSCLLTSLLSLSWSTHTHTLSLSLSLCVCLCVRVCASYKNASVIISPGINLSLSLSLSL
jgi:hypothetical protein